MRSRRAALAAIAGVIDQSSRVLVGFIVTPILVASLGAAGFGIWQIIFRTYLQLAPLDGRSAEVLKWTVAKSQSSDDYALHRSNVGAAAITSLFYLPLITAAFVIVISFLPGHLELGYAEAELLCDCLWILLFATIATSIAKLFEGVIRGMNLYYKLLGLQASMVFLGGALSCAAVWGGYGIKGLSFVQLLVATLSIPALVIAAFRLVPWVGWKVPAAIDLRVFLTRSFWFVAWEGISLWMLAGEIIILGLLANSTVVSQYVLTLYAVQIVTVAVITGVSSALPGLGGLLGEKQYQKAARIRAEGLNYSWILSNVICGVVLAFNQSFVSLWVGAEHFAGNVVNLLIVLCTLQLVFIRYDAFVLNIGLDIRKKVYYGLASVLLSLILMILLVPKFGLIGLCSALLIGRVILSASYPRLVKEMFKSEVRRPLDVKWFAIPGVTLIASFLLGLNHRVTDWVSLVWQAPVFGAVLLIVLLLLMLNADERRQLRGRFSLILG